MNAAKVAPVKNAPVAYIVEFAVIAGLYVVAILIRDRFLPSVADHRMAMALTALPVLPIWLMFLAVIRHYRRVDEMARLKLLQNISIAAGLMACFVTSYALLEDAGLPKLAITWAWPTLAIIWGVATAINELRER